MAFGIGGIGALQQLLQGGALQGPQGSRLRQLLEELMGGTQASNQAQASARAGGAQSSAQAGGASAAASSGGACACGCKGGACKCGGRCRGRCKGVRG